MDNPAQPFRHQMNLHQLSSEQRSKVLQSGIAVPACGHGKTYINIDLLLGGNFSVYKQEMFKSMELQCVAALSMNQGGEMLTGARC